MNDNFFSKVGIDDLHAIFYSFLKKHYLDRKLAKEHIVYTHLYQCHVIADLLESKGVEWFLASEHNNASFYEAIDFFDGQNLNQIKILFSQKKWKSEAYEQWYTLMDHVQDKGSAWIIEHSELFSAYIPGMEVIYENMLQLRAEIKERSKNNDLI